MQKRAMPPPAGSRGGEASVDQRNPEICCEKKKIGCFWATFGVQPSKTDQTRPPPQPPKNIPGYGLAHQGGAKMKILFRENENENLFCRTKRKRKSQKGRK